MISVGYYDAMFPKRTGFFVALVYIRRQTMPRVTQL